MRYPLKRKRDERKRLQNKTSDNVIANSYNQRIQEIHIAGVPIELHIQPDLQCLCGNRYKEIWSHPGTETGDITPAPMQSIQTRRI